MKLTSILFGNGRRPQNEKKVPFKAILPLKLKNFVSSKSQKTTERGCLYETTSLLTCLEENEFEDKNCIPEFNALNKCIKIYNDNMKLAYSVKQQMVPIPESKNLTHEQITRLLRRYPTI